MLKKSVFFKHSVLGSYRVKKYLDLVLVYSFREMAKNGSKFPKFSTFFWFLYQPWTIHFCNKKFHFFFLKKFPNFADFNEFFGLLQKKCSSQNCSRLRPHRVMLFKNWKIAKIRQISSIFQKKIEFFKIAFCTNHERSNFGIKKSTFFFSVENFANIFRISISFLPVF